jgi:hypothetical protein
MTNRLSGKCEERGGKGRVGDCLELKTVRPIIAQVHAQARWILKAISVGAPQIESACAKRPLKKICDSDDKFLGLEVA